MTQEHGDDPARRALRDKLLTEELARGFAEQTREISPFPPSHDDIVAWIEEHGVHGPGLTEHLMTKLSEFLGVESPSKTGRG